MKFKITTKLHSIFNEREINLKDGNKEYSIFVYYAVFQDDEMIYKQYTEFKNKIDKTYHYVYLTLKDNIYNIRLSNTAYDSDGTKKLNGETIIGFLFT